MKKFLFLFLVFLALLSGCSNSNEQVQEQEEPDKETQEEKTQEKEEKTEQESFDNIYPLTGIGTNDSVNNRIIGVMVNNHPKARPQTGLSQADIVFEILAEGMITRFLALYQSKIPNVVGPVRSAREYYFELADDYNALYVYHGAADFVDEMIINRGIDSLNGSIFDNDGHLFKRETFRNAPHNSYVLLESAYDVAERKGYESTVEYEPLPFLANADSVKLSGEPAQHIEVIYSEKYSFANVEFIYNEKEQKYMRYSNGEKSVELETEIPIQVENVFIIETDHKVIDDVGRREIDLTSGGDAYLIRKGIVQKVTWENRNGRIIPVKNGEFIGFVPGKTWVNVIPTLPGLEQSVIISD
ncbi:DUF3048 domain-containing protein [Oceanobacillus senegalensis]|uniref:DUF3048 domain-containing protein n=1 Tax=Oceanobacillus senegalensis TaxID=1936063 RepID=UPI000A30C0CD|nr:DUF3048 domain-containing protein [Oceanobacillus senegalensis]